MEIFFPSILLFTPSRHNFERALRLRKITFHSVEAVVESVEELIEN